jgi:hypothetical protein
MMMVLFLPGAWPGTASSSPAWISVTLSAAQELMPQQRQTFGTL